MSTSHHASPPGDDSNTRRFIDQVMGRAQQHFSEGRIHKKDEGDLAFAIAADKTNSVVLIHFGKPVQWIGMPKEQALQLAALLTEKASEL